MLDNLSDIDKNDKDSEREATLSIIRSKLAPLTREEISNYNFKFHFLAGRLAEKEGNFEKARAKYEAIHALFPMYWENQFFLVILLQKRFLEFKESLHHLFHLEMNRALSDNILAKIYVSISIAYKNLENYERFFAYIEKAFIANPLYDAIYATLAKYIAQFPEDLGVKKKYQEYEERARHLNPYRLERNHPLVASTHNSIQFKPKIEKAERKTIPVPKWVEADFPKLGQVPAVAKKWEQIKHPVKSIFDNSEFPALGASQKTILKPLSPLTSLVKSTVKKKNSSDISAVKSAEMKDNLVTDAIEKKEAVIIDKELITAVKERNEKPSINSVQIEKSIRKLPAVTKETTEKKLPARNPCKNFCSRIEKSGAQLCLQLMSLFRKPKIIEQVAEPKLTRQERNRNHRIKQKKKY